MSRDPYKNSNVPGPISDLLGLQLNPFLDTDMSVASNNLGTLTGLGGFPDMAATTGTAFNVDVKSPTSYAAAPTLIPKQFKVPEKRGLTSAPITPKTIETLSTSAPIKKMSREGMKIMAGKAADKLGFDGGEFASSGKGMIAGAAIQGTGKILEAFDKDEENYTEKGGQVESAVSDVVGTVAPLFGPVGMAVGAAATLGQKVEDLAKDENGLYRSKGAEIADQVLNPIGRTSDLVRNIVSKDLSLAEKGSAFLNYKTYGVLGKNAQQTIASNEAEKKRKKKARAAIAEQNAASIVAGNVQPKWTAKAYG